MKQVQNSTFEKFIRDNFPDEPNKWKSYISEKIQPHRSALSSVITAVKGIIEQLHKEYGEKENRDFAEVIDKNTIKSPERIVEKIVSQPKKYTLENFDTKMEDIARFRIVCNYLSDIFVLVERLRTDTNFNVCCRISERKDYIFDDRDKSHRAIHLILKAPTLFDKKERKIELQIMTQLQNAWDKKDHNLIYEKIRIGKTDNR